MKIEKSKETPIKKNITREILAGKIFIYPTDTIYGLGCDATNEKSVERIKEIKQRDRDKPLSVIAPNFEWIKANFEYDFEISKYLPGPYTLLLKKKNLDFLKHVSSNDRIGVRVPHHDFTKKIQEAGVPFITTSVNLAGEPFLVKIEDLKSEIREKVDYIIKAENENVLTGKPSILIIDDKEISRK